MKVSNLYYTLLNKPFFVDPRRIEAQAVLIDRLLSHDTELSSEKLSDRNPLKRAYLSPIHNKMSEGLTATGSATSDHFDEAPEGSVAVIGLKGDMLKSGTYCSYGTEELASLMDEATASERILGTILNVDSGGGSVDAIPPLVASIGRSRAAGKPVVAVCDLCASAAYYVACHCDTVLASNTLSAEFGSIGVLVQFADYQKYYEQKGIKVHTIYSDLSGYKNAPFEAALKGDYKAIKTEMLNPLALKFQQAVREHRRGLDETVEGVLEGRMFYAADAVRAGLADGVGGLGEGVDAVVRLAMAGEAADARR